MFDEASFNCFQSSAIYINVGRGKTTDENALIDSLKNKQLAFAILDVFENEPLSQNSELRSLENVLISPHVGCYHDSYWKKQFDLIKENFHKFKSNKQLINEL